MKLVSELRRRKVFRTAPLYAVAAWLRLYCREFARVRARWGALMSELLSDRVRIRT